MIHNRVWLVVVALSFYGITGCAEEDSGPNGSAAEDCCECVQSNSCGDVSFEFSECVSYAHPGFALAEYDFTCVADFCDSECADNNFLAAAGLHEDCSDSACLTGQDCITVAGAGGDTHTCEINCEADSDCPQEMKCNLAPIVPDSIEKTCIDE